MTELSKYRFQFRNARKISKNRKYDILIDYDIEVEKERIRRRNKKHEKYILKKKLIHEYPDLRFSVLNF
jgi:hypothetical protein